MTCACALGTLVGSEMAVVVCVVVLSLLAVSSVECGGREYEVRGLDPRHKPRYHPGKDFTCLDGSDTISFSMGSLHLQLQHRHVIPSRSERRLL